MAGGSESAFAQAADDAAGSPLSLQLLPFAELAPDGEPIAADAEGGPEPPGPEPESALEAPEGEPAPAAENEPSVDLPPPPPPRSARESPFAGALDVARQAQDPLAPAWLFQPRAMLDATVTDNARHTHLNHQSDLISRISAGLSLSADTPRLQGLASATVSFRRALNDSHYNLFSANGYLVSELTVSPNLFLDLHGTAHDIDRSGLGVPNPQLLTPEEQTQTYVLSVSPVLKARVGDFGLADLRYAYSRMWVDKNTGVTATLPPLGGANEQQVHADLRMPGTMMYRLLSEVSANASAIQVNKFPGTFKRASGELINEYMLTRSISAIAAGGYETLADEGVVRLNGEGAIWDAGARWRPNADSSLMVLYGRHDLKTDIAAEFRWRFAPTTAFYAAHTDSINATQPSFVTNNLDALLGPEGPSVGITFDQNPTIAALNNTSIGLYRRPQDIGLGIGLPLDEINNFLPAANGFFRLKQSRAALFSDVAGQAISLIGFHLERTSLVGIRPPTEKSDGVVLAWSPLITDDIVGRALVGYRIQEQTDAFGELHRSQSFNVGLALNYQATPTLEAGIRYDFIDRKVPATIVINAIRLHLEKRF